MSDLIEDGDGAPYPQCARCPDQIAPPGDQRPRWAHVYEARGGRRWYLFNCQRPTVGRYGDLDNQATPEGTRPMSERTNCEKVGALLSEVGLDDIARQLEPNRIGDPKIGLLRGLTVREAFKVMSAVDIVGYGADPGWPFLAAVVDPDAMRSVMGGQDQ